MQLSSCAVKPGEVTTILYLTLHCIVQTFFTCCSMTIPPPVLSPSSMHVMLGTDCINALTHTHTHGHGHWFSMWLLPLLMHCPWWKVVHQIP